MARGWESKSVESQQHEALDPVPHPAVAPGDAIRQTERAALSLARCRALADLQLACAPAHRAMLEQAIRDLDARITRLT